MMIIDYFPYFSKYGSEITDLRISVLKDHVDFFVISESNRTHTGELIERNFPKIAKELNFPIEKIIYIEDEIPDDEHLVVENIDILNTYESSGFSLNIENKKSHMARTRERLQKDALLLALEEFSDDDVFIHSDMDEIINPVHLGYLSEVCKQNQDIIVKIPLIYYETSADLRLYWKEKDLPVMWDGGMFLATKSQLKKANPSQIRSNIQNPFPIRYITEDGKRVEDLGWHFSWMGDSKYRKIKSDSWAHHNDSFSWMEFKTYSDSEYTDYIERHNFREGSIPPSGNKHHVLKKYTIDVLPKILLEENRFKRYFLPNLQDY